MDIFIIGTGYVGLVTGVCFAEMGHHVTCLDIDAKKIERLKEGHVPIYEPGLSELLQRNLAEGRLKFTEEYGAADVYFICVSTPSAPDGSADLSYFKEAAKSIARQLVGYAVIVNKSTVPVGTADLVHEIVSSHTDHPFDIVSNPEFLKEGAAINDCMKPDRIIIGSNSDRAIKTMKSLYAAFTHNHDRMIVMDPKSAELTKYAANAMLATRISFMNEMALLCESVGANVNQVRIGIGSDKRIGFDFLYPGAGYGGSCFRKDLRALLHTAHEHHCTLNIVESTEKVNEAQKLLIYRKLHHYFGDLKGKIIGIWGLSFKPDTDDIRESASIALIQALIQAGCTVKCYDPVAINNAKKVIPEAHFAKNELDAAHQADALVLITEWKQFRYVDLGQIFEAMEGSAFFDGRNQYAPEEMERLGFKYFPIGQKR
ncbi:MAG: UDP-glucose/GDP-mannose dehydrogenase family protein [Simkaniaceae bacterium]|nr:UDP-glucose/GDP-mannose dehydrogenase family protein [Simkaniaceae bacterium]